MYFENMIKALDTTVSLFLLAVILHLVKAAYLLSYSIL